LLTLISSSSWLVVAFTSSITTTTHYDNIIFQTLVKRRQHGGSPLCAALRKDVEIPLLDLIGRATTKSNNDKDDDDDDDDDTADENAFVVPLPSSDFPDQLATPFLYGMQMDTPLHKLILEEAISMAKTAIVSSAAPLSSLPKPFYGHLVWKDGASDSLVGAIGCTAEILVNAPTTQLLGGGPKTPLEEELAKLEKSFSDSKGGEEKESSKKASMNDDNSAPTSNTVLCRGGWRFVVKEIVRSIPYPVVIVDEIQDDADVDDSDMFSTFGAEEEDDDDEEDDELINMPAPELIGNTMRNVQSIITQQLEDAIAKTQMGPLEQSILEDGEMEGGGKAINPAVIGLAHAEEMSAVWSVFQMSLVDDIEPSQRRFAVAIMAAELANLNNDLRQEILLIRNAEERLRIVLRELKEIVGMAQARKVASSITDKTDETDRDLTVGAPQLPPWARQITKGNKIEYFWNKEYGWCPGVVTEDPVTIADELLLTIRFEDGEEHRLPLTAEDKLRWRPSK
jgi:hypothetical protein